ncbi:MAG: hypothetical protein EA396_11670 [Anaerolineaceae bacterium]|nr:MAG: hypothetical protein EA396_11670 [Anaerolineaceae bacterium]
MAPGKPSALIKPTLNTKFHIDYDWWERSRDDLRLYLISHLPPEQREHLSQMSEQREIDYIDPDTGEVSRLDELQLAIQLAAQDPDFINPQTSLVDSVFRVFLKNKNVPMTPKQLAEATERPADTILKTLSGRQIYKGIRPFLARVIDQAKQ